MTEMTKTRPGWLVALRVAGLVGIVGCLIAVGGFLGQSLAVITVATWVIVAAAVVAIGAAIARIAR